MRPINLNSEGRLGVTTMRSRLILAVAFVFAMIATVALIATVHAQAQQAAQGQGAGGQRGGGQRGGGQRGGVAGDGQVNGAPPPGRGFGRANTPTFAGPPAGMQALPMDMFTSKNFYKDKALWSDKRYFRCNTPRQITDIWTSHRIGNNAPASAAWGDCSSDYPREKIVSPYSYTTARSHYAALMAAAKANGSYNVRTRATVPDWDGYYTRDTKV